MTPEAQLLDTVGFVAAWFARGAAQDAFEPWLVAGGVLMAQQAAVIALRAAGDSIPAKAGGTELLLRAASKDRLPAPFTLPFGMSARQRFNQLVEARNAFMHPRGLDWRFDIDALQHGMPIATKVVRHLILTQPILNDLISSADQPRLRDDLRDIDTCAEFLSDRA